MRYTWQKFTLGVIAVLLIGICSSYFISVKKSRDYAKIFSYAYAGKDRELRRIIHGFDVNYTPEHGKMPTILSAAVDGRHLSTVRLLLAAGADPNIKTGAGTPLASAIRHADTDIVQALLDHGASIDPGSLLDASRAKHVDMCAMLLSAGANPNDLLMLAAHSGNVELVKLLLKTNKEQARQAKGGQPILAIDSAISIAQKRQQTEVVKVLAQSRNSCR